MYTGANKGSGNFSFIFQHVSDQVFKVNNSHIENLTAEKQCTFSLNFKHLFSYQIRNCGALLSCPLSLVPETGIWKYISSA